MIQLFKKQIYPNGVKTLNDTLKGYETFANVVGVYDGDTITCIFKLKDNEFAWKCRLSYIDCAEMISKNPLEKKHAISAQKYVENMILDKKVYLKCNGTDKYGRVLVSVFVNPRIIFSINIEFDSVNENDPKIYTLNLNDDLIDKKYARFYNGKRNMTVY